jgi:hypothetical protein
MGIVAKNAFLRASISAGSSVRKNAGSPGVSTEPGAMALTRMPSAAHASAIDRTRAMMPPLVNEYIGLNGDPISPDVDDVKITEAPLAALSADVRYPLRKKDARALISMPRSHSSLESSSPAAPGTPTLL